jgi:hypothetical protein
MFCVTTGCLLVYVIRLSYALYARSVISLVDCCWDVNLADDDPNGSAASALTRSICHMASHLPLVRGGFSVGVSVASMWRKVSNAVTVGNTTPV